MAVPKQTIALVQIFNFLSLVEGGPIAIRQLAARPVV